MTRASMTKPTPALIEAERDRPLNRINNLLSHRWRPHKGTFVQDFAPRVDNWATLEYVTMTLTKVVPDYQPTNR